MIRPYDVQSITTPCQCIWQEGTVSVLVRRFVLGFPCFLCLFLSLLWTICLQWGLSEEVELALMFARVLGIIRCRGDDSCFDHSVRVIFLFSLLYSCTLFFLSRSLPLLSCYLYPSIPPCSLFTSRSYTCKMKCDEIYQLTIWPQIPQPTRLDQSPFTSLRR